jgi:hypothetical protein
MPLNCRLASRRLGLLAALALAGLAPPARAGELDQYLPADSILVIKVNVRQLLDSRLAKDYWAEGLRRQYEKDYGEVQAFFKDVGFDPFKDLDRVILTGPGDDAPRKGLAIFGGRFDPAKVRAKVDDLNKAQAGTVKVHLTPDGKGGDYRIYQADPGSPGSLFIALPDATTVFLSVDKDVVLEALKKVGAQGKVELKDKDLQAALENLDDKPVMSVAGVGGVLEKIASPDAPAAIMDSIQRVAAFSGGLTLGEDVKLEVALTAKTEAEAKALHAAAGTGVRLALAAMALKGDEDNPLDELLFDVVGSIRVRCKDRTVLFKGRVNVEEAEEALQKAGLDVEQLKEALKKPFDK